MNTLYKSFVLAALLTTCTLARAYDFEAGGLYYNIMSVNERTVEVTYQGDAYTATPTYTGTINIPATVQYQSVTFNVVRIGECAFYNCQELTSVTFPEGLTTIDGNAFNSCTALTDVTFPSTLSAIGDWAFQNCHSFVNVVIPPTIVHIGTEAITGDSVLTLTIQDSPNPMTVAPYFHPNIGFRFPNVKQTYVGRDCGGWQAPASLIDSWHGPALERVEFGNYVTEVPYCMLYGDAYNLTELILSPNTKKIAWGALGGCYALTRLELPESVEEIDEAALGGGWDEKAMALTHLVIGSKVKSIGAKAFYGCSNLKTVTMRHKGAFEITEDTFYPTTYLNAELYVPEGCIQNSPLEGDKLELYLGYGETNYWKNFLTIKEGEPNGIRQTAAAAFSIVPGNGFVTVKGLTRGASIAVYTADGKLTTQRTATTATERIVLPPDQVYIITAKGRSAKVRL